jgi:hypothetical protein
LKIKKVEEGRNLARKMKTFGKWRRTDMKGSRAFYIEIEMGGPDFLGLGLGAGLFGGLKNLLQKPRLSEARALRLTKLLKSSGLTGA